MNRTEAIVTIRKALEVFANEQELMSYTSAGDPKLHNEMIEHCVNNCRAKDALDALSILESSDGNVLPELPDGWEDKQILLNPPFHKKTIWTAWINHVFEGEGDSPRSALIAAIAKIPAGKDGGE